MRVEDIKPGVLVRYRSTGILYKVISCDPYGWNLQDEPFTNVDFLLNEPYLTNNFDLVEEKNLWTPEEPEAQIKKKDENHKCRCDWNDLLRNGCQCGGS